MGVPQPRDEPDRAVPRAAGPQPRRPAHGAAGEGRVRAGQDRRAVRFVAHARRGAAPRAVHGADDPSVEGEPAATGVVGAVPAEPVPDEGIYIRDEYFRYEPTPPAHYGRKVFQAWDFAIGEKQQNDYTVGVTLIQDERDFLHCVELVRFKGDSYTIVEEILQAAARWGSEPTAPLTIGFEDGQIWKSIKPLLEKVMSERGEYPPYEVLRPLTDKMARARPLQGRMQQGRVFFPSEAAWLPEVKKELLRFPAGAHDDIVDALAWAVTLAVGSAPPMVAKPKKIASWKDKLMAADRTGASHMTA